MNQEKRPIFRICLLIIGLATAFGNKGGSLEVHQASAVLNVVTIANQTASKKVQYFVCVRDSDPKPELKEKITKLLPNIKWCSEFKISDRKGNKEYEVVNLIEPFVLPAKEYVFTIKGRRKFRCEIPFDNGYPTSKTDCIELFPTTNAIMARSKIWELRPLKQNAICWCIIRDLDSSDKLLHIEVVCRKNGAESWDLEKILPHLAITQTALEKSLVNPNKKGDVYPEQYEEQFTKWKEERSRGPAYICDESIEKCLVKK